MCSHLILRGYADLSTPLRVKSDLSSSTTSNIQSLSFLHLDLPGPADPESQHLPRVLLRFSIIRAEESLYHRAGVGRAEGDVETARTHCEYFIALMHGGYEARVKGTLARARLHHRPHRHHYHRHFIITEPISPKRL